MRDRQSLHASEFPAHFGCESGLKDCLKQQCYVFIISLSMCMSVTPQNVFEHIYTVWYHAVFIGKYHTDQTE